MSYLKGNNVTSSVRSRLSRLSIFFLVLLTSPSSQASSDYDISLLHRSMAPNAGGQYAYALRWGFDKDNKEVSFFSNQFLYTGNIPLSGFVYSLRYSVCSYACVIRPIFQVGAGISSSGPMLELLWTIIPFWIFRVDIATHFYYSTTSPPAIWNYPIWIGMTLPL